MISSRASVLGTVLSLALLVSSETHGITSCRFGTIVSVSFGSYDVFASVPLDSTGSIELICDGVQSGEVVQVEISQGSAASFSPREMRASDAVLQYNLYLNAARTTVWGDGSSGTSRHTTTFHDAGDGLADVVEVYGRVPALQNVAVGAYSDTVTVTLLF